MDVFIYIFYIFFDLWDKDAKLKTTLLSGIGLECNFVKHVSFKVFEQNKSLTQLWILILIYFLLS